MKELEELTREIREKLSRLMELEVGCKFTRKDEFGIIWENVILQVGGGGQIADTGDYHDACYDVYSDRDGIETFTDLDREIENVIGKDPMLNDVLEWMPDNSVFMNYNMTGVFWKDGKIDTLSDCQSYMTDIIQLGKWDLSNPYLKEQSPELIAFLHSLIKK